MRMPNTRIVFNVVTHVTAKGSVQCTLLYITTHGRSVLALCAHTDKELVACSVTLAD